MTSPAASTTFTHKSLASSCFNQVWDLLDKADRSASDTETMVHLCHSSFWHWTQVPEHTQTNLSIGYWQLARVYAVIGSGEQALAYANRCIEVSEAAELEPFYIAYGYEAAARAYAVMNQADQQREAAETAARYTEQVADAESKSWLLKDLATI
ncbi:hypothetical protein A8990_1536 [Paenibacillus taihuensis]|uniref:Uncharacterized protein n=1 Tax=Paenibacillus taihuensis TaxID=1156355 RepID=A0A3D9Q3S2_9BACL|nr:hypothetical protein [Paenibacillus taihuensis]REE57497.1 hypothetical protein A8990_1536 [Paenibacillus taihuensis]